MLFKKCELIENKLSEKISDSNPLKNKLVEMEIPSNKSPIYSFLSIGLLAYIWLFLCTLIYKQANGIGYAIFSVLFTTICFFFVYKKPYLTSTDRKLKKIANIIILITIVLSTIIAIADKGNFPLIKMINIFLFFLEINAKSYMALAVLSSLCLSISFCYLNSPYEAYRSFYSIKNKDNDDADKEIYKYFILTILIILAFIPAIQSIFNTPKDSYGFILKIFSLAYFLMFFPLITITFQAKKYLNIFKRAQKIDNSQDKKGM